MNDDTFAEIQERSSSWMWRFQNMFFRVDTVNSVLFDPKYAITNAIGTKAVSVKIHGCKNTASDDKNGVLP